MREHVSGRYIALIGPKAAHGAPYLDIPGTNFYCLRSFVDRGSAETAHQLYVADSYDAPERHWDTAHDQAGRALVFVPISHDTISCEGGCSYTEEFAANLADNELSDNPQGFTVTFSDRAADNMTITVSADQIATQLAAVAAQPRTGRPTVTEPVGSGAAAAGGSPGGIGLGLSPVEGFALRQAALRGRQCRRIRAGAARVVPRDHGSGETGPMRRGSVQRRHGLNPGEQHQQQDRHQPSRGDDAPAAELTFSGCCPAPGFDFIRHPGTSIHMLVQRNK